MPTYNFWQIFEENCYIFIFYLAINFKFLQDAISGIYYILRSYKCYQLILITEFNPDIKYFDLT